MGRQRARMSQQEWGHPQGDGTRGTSIPTFWDHPRSPGGQGSSSWWKEGRFFLLTLGPSTPISPGSPT